MNNTFSKSTKWATGGILLLWLMLFIARLTVPSLTQKGWSIAHYAFIEDSQVSNDGVLHVDSRDALHNITTLTINAIRIDARGQIWLATDEGLGLRDVDGHWTLFVAPDSTHTINNISKNVHIAAGGINDLEFDQQGQVWVSTPFGVSRMTVDETWTTYDLETLGITDDYIATLAIGQQDRVWIGTRRGTILTLDPQSGEIQHAAVSLENPATNMVVRTMTVDAQGQVWIGTNSGLKALAPDGSQIIQSAFEHQFVSTLAMDETQHQLWVGTAFTSDSVPSLKTLLPDGREVTRSVEDYKHTPAPDVAIDGAGNTWARKYGELAMITPDGHRTGYFAPQGLRGLAIDPQEQVWSVMHFLEMPAVDEQGNRFTALSVDGIATFDAQRGVPLKWLSRIIVKPGPILIVLTMPIASLLLLSPIKKAANKTRQRLLLLAGYGGWFVLYTLAAFFTHPDYIGFILPPIALALNIVALTLFIATRRWLFLGMLLAWVANSIVVLYLNLNVPLAPLMATNIPYYILRASRLLYY